MEAKDAGTAAGAARPDPLADPIAPEVSARTILVRGTVVMAAVELVLMFLLPSLIESERPWLMALTDTALLVVLTVPVVFFGVIRPYHRALKRTLVYLDAARCEALRLAQTDALTGLANRRKFFERLEQEWARASRYGTPLACIVLDVDFFKAVNDAHGHAAGDQVLRALALELAGGCRETDTAARIGGEEMAILLPGTDESGAVALAHRLRERVEGLRVQVGEADVRVTASFGVSVRAPETGSHDELLARADAALFESKRGGRNRVNRA